MLMLESVCGVSLQRQEEFFIELYRRILGSSGSKPRAGDSCVWCTWSTCLASSRSLSMSARSKINQRRSNLERSAGGRFMFSAGVLRKSYLPLHRTQIYTYIQYRHGRFLPQTEQKYPNMTWELGTIRFGTTWTKLKSKIGFKNIRNQLNMLMILYILDNLIF